MIAQREAETVAPAWWRDCEAVAVEVRRTGLSAVVSSTIRVPVPTDPPTWFARAGQHYAHRFYWERPRDGLVLCGAGAARAIRWTGPAPLRDAAATLRDDATIFRADALTETLGGPLYFGGFAFDPTRPTAPEWATFPAGLLILPRFLLLVREGEATLTVSIQIEPNADWISEVTAALHELSALAAPLPPTPASVDAARVLAVTETPIANTWQAAVARTAAEIRDGRFAKVVLARRVDVRTAAPVAPATALRHLRATYPSSYVFAVETPEQCFLGATPERLIRLDGRQVHTACLAGSIARGATMEEDARLAQMLLASAKDRAEHHIVVRAIEEALTAVCDEVFADATPQLLKVRNVQHLYTPIRGRLATDRDILDLVERLHPTPAVGGFPRAAALAAIREREGFDRGWYAGPIGWIDRTGGGEFAVAIRSALLAPDRATLYAGCGIMANSDPATEYAETNLKLRPMRAALGV